MSLGFSSTAASLTVLLYQGRASGQVGVGFAAGEGYRAGWY